MEMAKLEIESEQQARKELAEAYEAMRKQRIFHATKEAIVRRKYQDEIKKLKGENEAARQLAEQCRAAQQLSNEKLVELKTIFDIADKQRKELQTVSEASTQEKHKEAARASKLQT